MSVKLSDLAAWIDKALTREPPARLAGICGDYYSPYYFFLWRAAGAMKRQGLAVELGVESGRGSVAMALADGQVIGIDHTESAALTTLLKDFSNIQFFQRDTLPVPMVLAHHSPLKIALLHIDTEHSYSMAKAEFEAYRPLLASPAVVVFDDLHAQDDDVLKYFVSLPYPKIIDDRMHPSCGWGVLLYQE